MNFKITAWNIKKNRFFEADQFLAISVQKKIKKKNRKRRKIFISLISIIKICSNLEGNLRKKFLVVGILENFENFLKLMEILLPRFFSGAFPYFKGNEVKLRRQSLKAVKQQMNRNTTNFLKARIYKLFTRLKNSKPAKQWSCLLFLTFLSCPVIQPTNIGRSSNQKRVKNKNSNKSYTTNSAGDQILPFREEAI